MADTEKKQGTSGRKYSKRAQEEIAKTMRKFKRGTLKSSSGHKVTSRDQAIAIGISEARDKGLKTPPEKDKD
ncbi:MAG: hypothetical protein GX540_00565 [Clostridiales bacterium]|nr:hypothetical protein [Clostridiales bacterium]